ncbi:MAG: ADP-ribosylglycohydrolase family protein [Spirochaetota bacterium]
MRKIPENYVNKVYAGLLGKIIGIRHGAPVEGWDYEKIKNVYGEIDGYLVDYRNFAADDDSNGPMFFIRALEDFTLSTDLTSEQIGLTWLNYVPYEHGFFWWGGYGKSTEHTAYQNLKCGIMAPRSGSIEQNGAAVAEQVGGQIFIDTWGLAAPDNPMLAAQYAEKAAGVSHGGNGIYGGMFIAACISAAFSEQNIENIIRTGLSVIPTDCEYARVTNEIIRFYKTHPENWRECFQFVKENFGYDKYPGWCHIIPNAAVIILSLLYGRGEFSKAINICNMSGWDTDCNVGNLGTIMGVKCGLEGIENNKWRKPINDLLICSSIIGSLNILDIPWCAAYIANLGYKIAGEESPQWLKDSLERKTALFHFEFPDSTHGFKAASNSAGIFEYELYQTTEIAHSGTGALKIVGKHLSAGNELRVFHKTYYRPSDFNDSRYDPNFSPILYPGQKLTAFVMVPGSSDITISGCIYVKEGNTNSYLESEKKDLVPAEWNELRLNLPHLKGACLEEFGVKLIVKKGKDITLVAYLDDINFYGEPDYTIDFTKERMEVWNGLHREVSQFTYLKGIWELEQGELSGSCCDIGEAYTGGYSWRNYTFNATIIPRLGEYHNINFRVQGAIRSYALGLAPGNKLVLYKNELGYRVLTDLAFPWEHNREYVFQVILNGSHITAKNNEGEVLINYHDKNNPYLSGQIGVSIRNGSHCHYKDFKIGRITDGERHGRK